MCVCVCVCGGGGGIVGEGGRGEGEGGWLCMHLKESKHMTINTLKLEDDLTNTIDCIH